MAFLTDICRFNKEEEKQKKKGEKKKEEKKEGIREENCSEVIEDSETIVNIWSQIWLNIHFNLVCVNGHSFFFPHSKTLKENMMFIFQANGYLAYDVFI